MARSRRCRGPGGRFDGGSTLGHHIRRGPLSNTQLGATVLVGMGAVVASPRLVSVEGRLPARVVWPEGRLTFASDGWTIVAMRLVRQVAFGSDVNQKGTPIACLLRCSNRTTSIEALVTATVAKGSDARV